MVKEHVTPEWIEQRRAALPDEMLALVSRMPGRSMWVYIALRLADGGLRGMTDDKEAAFKKLVREGKLVPGINRGLHSKVKGWYPAGHPELNAAPPNLISKTDIELQQAIKTLVTAQPGRSFSYYCRLEVSAGGLRGSQERKERALKALLDSQQLFSAPLPKPMARMTYGIYPVE